MGDLGVAVRLGCGAGESISSRSALRLGAATELSGTAEARSRRCRALQGFCDPADEVLMQSVYARRIMHMRSTSSQNSCPRRWRFSSANRRI